MRFQDKSNQVTVFPNEGVCLKRLCESVTLVMMGCKAEIKVEINVRGLVDLDD